MPLSRIIPMRNKLPRMKLSRDEDNFLRHWVYDEAHYQSEPGLAKRLQVEHRIVPADIAALVAAAMPDLDEQEAVGAGPPPSDPPNWPWSDQDWTHRLAEARALLAQRPRERLGSAT